MCIRDRILGGLGFPIPEDIPLLLAGIAAAGKIVSAHNIFLTCLIGVIVADQIVFVIGYLFGKRLLDFLAQSKFFPSVTTEKIHSTREALRRRRLLYIFIGRHLFPVRSITFLTAGALRIPYLEFLLSDAFAATVSVSLMLAIGYILGYYLPPEVVTHLVRKAHFYVMAIAVIITIALLVRVILAKKKRKD